MPSNTQRDATRSCSASSDGSSDTEISVTHTAAHASHAHDVSKSNNNYGPHSNNLHRRSQSEPAPTTAPLKSCLKIKTAEESLQSVYSERHGPGSPSKSMRALTSLRSVSKSLQNLSSFDLSPRSSPSNSTTSNATGTGKDRRGQFENAKTTELETEGKSQKHFNFFDAVGALLRGKGSTKILHESSSSLNKTSKNHKKVPSVQFDNISIREYKQEVGDNPAVTLGPAVQLGWEYTNTLDTTVDTFEQVRAPKRHTLGSSAYTEMMLTPAERTRRLRECGVSNSEIEQSMNEIQRAQEKREKTLKRMKHHTVEERLESMGKGIKRVLGMKKSQKKAEKELWKDAESYFAVRA